MGDLWLKIKVWSKGIGFALVIIYVLVFIVENSEPVPFWWWYNRNGSYSKLVLIAISFAAGAISFALVRTILRTMRQIRDLRMRSRANRVEQELAELKDKASRLQTKPISVVDDDAPPSPS